MHRAPMICPKGEGIWLRFHRKSINCRLKHCEIWKQDQYISTKLLRFLRNYKKLEIAQNAKDCSKNGEVTKTAKLVENHILADSLCRYTTLCYCSLLRSPKISLIIHRRGNLKTEHQMFPISPVYGLSCLSQVITRLQFALRAPIYSWMF